MGCNKGCQLVVLDAAFFDELGNQRLGLFDAGDRFGGGGFFVHQCVTALQHGFQGSNESRSLFDVPNTWVGVGTLLDGFHDKVLGVAAVKGGVLVEQLDTREGRFYLGRIFELDNKFVEGSSEDCLICR